MLLNSVFDHSFFTFHLSFFCSEGVKKAPTGKARAYINMEVLFAIEFCIWSFVFHPSFSFFTFHPLPESLSILYQPLTIIYYLLSIIYYLLSIIYSLFTLHFSFFLLRRSKKKPPTGKARAYMNMDVLFAVQFCLWSFVFHFSLSISSSLFSINHYLWAINYQLLSIRFSFFIFPFFSEGAKKKPLRKSERLFLMNMAATYSPALLCSTIGHEGLNFSVRDGKRWTPSAKPP